MATTKTNPADEPVDFDDLLALTNDDEPSAQEDSAPTESPAAEEAEAAPAAPPAKRQYNRKPKPEAAPEETPEQKRIRELEAALAEPMPSFDENEEAAQELTAEQKKILELEDQLAKRNAKIAESAPAQFVKATGETILIHIVEDGFTALGTTWYRGQELEFEVGGAAYKQTQDRNGKSWVDLAGNVEAQYARWGKQYLGVGKFIPRPNEKFDDDLAKADARRGRAVPLLRV